MLDMIFMRVLDMTGMASVVILVIMLARMLLQKVPKVFSYGLWAVVLFRLLCPAALEAPVSIVPKVASVSETYALAEESISIVGAGEAAYRAVGDALNGGLGVQHIRTTEVDQYGIPRYVHTDWWDVWILFGQYIWLAGVIVMVLYHAIVYRKLRKDLQAALRLRDNIYLAEKIHSPFVSGFVRPKIYLPGGIQDKEQEYIILHEQYHIKRRDPIIKVLAFLALCIHWFNPLVWISFNLACKDMEMSCDEAVVRKMGKEVRADYAALLLRLTSGHRIIAGTPLAFGEGDTKGRIQNLARWKKPAVLTLLAAGLVCTILVICLVTNHKSKDTMSIEGVHEREEIIMTPSRIEMTGAFDSYLYVPLDGEIYRYERIDMEPKNITADELLDRFTEKADPKDVEWAVYSVKDYPDHSVVFAVAGEDYRCLYQYSPSKRSDPDALQQAKEKGYVIMEDGDVTSGQQKWMDFVKETGEGKSASVKVGHYYTLNPESCSKEYYQVYEEDYPILYVFDLTYDGRSYTLCHKEGSTEYISNYKYLMCYTGEAPTPNATYDSYTRYVLTNDDTVTWDDIRRGLFSSRMEDYIKHTSIYTDLQQKSSPGGDDSENASHFH